MECQQNRVNIPPTASPPSPLSRQPLGAAADCESEQEWR